MYGGYGLLVAVVACLFAAWWVAGRPGWRWTVEPFLLSSPMLIKLETIPSEVLQQFNVFESRVFDNDKVKLTLAGLVDKIGSFNLVEVADRPFKQVIDDIARARGDYSLLKNLFGGFVVAVAVDSNTQSTSYYTVEKPWALKTDVFQSTDYMQKSDAGRIYVPAWQYARVDPSPFFIPPACMEVLTKWQNTTDARAIIELERSECLSRENKVKFVGMVLLNYLSILEQNHYGFQAACTDFAAVASNLPNPELKRIFEQVNEVCKDSSKEAAPIPEGCVLPYNDWLMRDQVSTDNDCMTREGKTAFLKRLSKFLDIGATMPVEYLDSFYLVVNQLYSEAKNARMQDFLKTYTVATENADRWKSVMDDMFKDIVKPERVTLNGTQIKYVSLDEPGFTAENPSDGSRTVSVIEFTFAAPHRFRTVITKPNENKQHIVKFSLSYEDPFVPDKFIDFDRVLYANTGSEGVQINSLNDLTTARIRVMPLEWSDELGGRFGFEGVKVELDKCSQTMSVCRHESIVAKEKSYYSELSEKYQAERQEKSQLSTQVAEFAGQLVELNRQVDDAEARLEATKAAKCPPAVQCLPYPIVAPVRTVIQEVPPAPAPAAPIPAPAEVSTPAAAPISMPSPPPPPPLPIAPPPPPPPPPALAALAPKVAALSQIPRREPQCEWDAWMAAAE